ncbi:uncharacterized protein LOC119568461 [Penaeus monodon]|uniref:uncharacterized protein LOC119568461 n=1 Tax=Penaeus monodon TaxID=6687 RepID=UPI0018A78243|nr:uncharacterized protein LOC119568461 [Penaeus monodon]
MHPFLLAGAQLFPPDKERVMMSFLGDRMPLAPLSGKEIVGTGVSVKEELSEDVTDDACLEIKEEPLDGDEARNDVCNVNVMHESHFFHNLHDLRHESHAKDFLTITITFFHYDAYLSLHTLCCPVISYIEQCDMLISPLYCAYIKVYG